jgi:hypothetical protein
MYMHELEIFMIGYSEVRYSVMRRLLFSSGGVRLGKIGLLFFLVFLVACNSSNQVVKPTPNSVAGLAFSDIALDIPPAALTSPVVGQLPDSTLMHVRLMFKIQGQQSQSGISSTAAGQGQDLEKLANQIGISDATYEQIKSVLGVQGVTLTLSKLHTELKMDATARTIGALFQTHFEIHAYNGRTFYAPVTAPKLPTFIVNYLVAVSGLDSYSAQLKTGFSGVAHSLEGTALPGRAEAGCTPLPPSNELYPRNVADAYGFTTYYQHKWHGEGLTINLVEIDGLNPSDVAFYQQCVGYQGHITVKNVDSIPSQAEGESALDVEMITIAAETHPHSSSNQFSRANGADTAWDVGTPHCARESCSAR